MLHLCWVLISFFAVIGVFECILEILDWCSFRKTRSVERVMLQVTLKGEVPNAEYLLNALCLKAERADIGKAETALTVIDGGLTADSKERILRYCEKNPWVIFTEQTDCDKI